MNRSYVHVARLVFERPWAILPSTLATITEVVALRLAGTPLSADDIQERLAAAPQRSRRQSGGGAVAVIPVQGVIMPRASIMTEMSGGTSAEAIGGAIRAAAADEEVTAIVLDIDSPGGSVEGMPELAATVREARASKPIVAIANHMAASAAYWIGSQADEFVATPSSVVGSVGVYMAHMDESEAYAKEGVNPTVISAGKFKTEGLPYGPLTEEARAHFQEDVDAYYAMFTNDVAKGRRIPAGTVRSGYGQGRALIASAALDAGMVDRVDTLEATIVRAARGGVKPRAELGPDGFVAVVPVLAGEGVAAPADGAMSEPIDGDPEGAPLPDVVPDMAGELEAARIRSRQRDRALLLG